MQSLISRMKEVGSCLSSKLYGELWCTQEVRRLKVGGKKGFIRDGAVITKRLLNDRSEARSFQRPAQVRAFCLRRQSSRGGWISCASIATQDDLFPIYACE